MDRPKPSYNELLKENENLSQKAKNYAYELESAKQIHVLDLQSLAREAETMQKKINELKAANQELKNTIERYEMENAGESW